MNITKATLKIQCKIVLLMLVVALGNNNLFAQAASATWALTSATAVVTGNITANDALAVNVSSGGFNQTCNTCGNAWVTSGWGTGSGGTGTCAYNYTRYVEFAVSPQTGSTVNVTNFSFYARGAFSNCNTRTNSYRIRYSTDNFNTYDGFYNPNSPFNEYEYSLPNTADCGQRSHSVNVNVTSGQTLRFRIYVYSCDNSYKNVFKNVVINGTTSTPCVDASISTPPSNVAVCEGEQAVLSVAAAGTNLTYQWRTGTTPLQNSGNVSGASSANLTITNTTTSNAAADYNVVVTAQCGASVVSSNASLTVNTLPATPVAAITNNSPGCGSVTHTYTTTPPPGISWYWQTSATGTATTNSTGSYNVTSNGTSYLRARNNTTSCWSAASQSTAVASIISAPAQPGAFTQSTVAVCANTNGVAYTVPTVNGATSYTWSYSGTGATINGTTNNVTVDFAANATAGNLSVTANNTCGSGAAQTVAVTINSAPAQPGAFTQSTTDVCAGANGVGYTVPTVNGATSYTWSYSGTGATINGTTNNVTVDFAANATAGTLSVIANNTCGSSSAQTVAITFSGAPAQPGAFTQSTATLCAGTNGVAYEVPTVNGATSYTWAYSGTGATINGTTNSVTVDFAANATAGTLSVTANNTCGAGTAQTVAVTVNGAPAQPGAFTQSTATLCAGANGVAYEVPTVNGATSYTWAYSGTGATINGTTNSVTVDFAANATAGTLSVTADNTCGASTPQSVAITFSGGPAQPGAFSQSTATLCAGTNGVVYEVPVVNGATTYNWSYSGTGATINGTTNSVTIDFAVGATNGTLSVTAENSCGTSTAQTLAITIDGLPAQPGSFTQSTANVCAGTNGTVYEVPVVNGANTYNWTYSGTGGTINGSGNSVTVDFSSTATGGTLSVTAENGCGNSAAQTVAITVGELPAQPSAITGDASICEGATTPYSVTAVNGVSYVWTLPNTWQGSSTTESISITAGNSGGNVEVYATNACGNSATTSLQVSVNLNPSVTLSLINSLCTTTPAFTLSGGLPAGGSYTVDGTPATNFTPSAAGTFDIAYQYTDGNGCSASATESITVSVCSGIEDALSATLKVYPNPASFTLVIDMADYTNDAVVTIHDLSGKVVLSTNINGTQSVDISTLAKGLYYVNVNSQGNNQTAKVAIK